MKIFGYELKALKKAVVALIGAALMVAVTVAGAFTELAPGVATAANSVVGVLTVVSVFIAKNEDLFDDFADDGKLGNKLV